MKEYRYALIRYIPNRERMEPINIGIILQDDNRIDFQLSPHIAKRKDIDTEVFKQWRQFLRDEIRGDHVPLFQPDKTSPAFLRYLEHLCEGAVLLSRPLVHTTALVHDFDEVKDALYRRLVAPPEMTSEVAASRPSGRFRQLAEKRNFLKRGMRRYSRITVPDKPGWTAYRHIQNGAKLAIDKVEVNNQPNLTVSEIERIPYILQSLPVFLEGKAGMPTQYVLLADKLESPFAEQPKDEFEIMQQELETMVERVQKAGGEVVRTANQTENLAEKIERMLSPALSAENE